jgi:hypothetical protein
VHDGGEVLSPLLIDIGEDRTVEDDDLRILRRLRNEGLDAFAQVTGNQSGRVGGDDLGRLRSAVGAWHRVRARSVSAANCC